MFQVKLGTWLDPTDPYSRPGNVPSMDQGYLALVVRPGMNELIRIPELSAEENKLIKKRDIFLAEDGKGRVVESVEVTGVMESTYRYNWDQPDPKKTREYLKSYIEEEFKSKELGEYSFSKAMDLSQPFTIKIEAKSPERFVTKNGRAIVGIMPGSLANNFLPDFSIEDFSKDDKVAEEAFAKRTNDVLLDFPFISEFRYHIVQPPGFVASPLPENIEEKFGPALYSRTFKLEEDGSISIVVTFNTIKRRYTAEEARQFKEQVMNLRKADGFLVSFENTGESLLAAGKIREALIEFEKMVALHPGEALHQTQIARALLQAGFGAAARTASQKAITLEPKSALAHYIHAIILEYDYFGRLLKKGFDLKGAEDELRKAMELDPDDIDYKLQLAILLEIQCRRNKVCSGRQT